MYQPSTLRKTFRQLAANSKLDYIFSVLKQKLLKHQISDLTEEIIAAFNEAVLAKQYIIAFKLYKNYDLYLIQN